MLILLTAPACVQRLADGRRAADSASASDSALKVDTGAAAAQQPATATPTTTAGDPAIATPEQPFASPQTGPQAAPVVGSPQPVAPTGVSGTAPSVTPGATSGARSGATSGATGSNAAQSDMAQLVQRHLIVPISGIPAAKLPDTFDETRGGTRKHEALDILAPRGTPVHSADDGTVIKLFTSKAGGLTVYVTGPGQRFIYYYAHLNAYVTGLAEGQVLHKGDVLGYVGSTGDADANVPHLHFAIARTDNIKDWWKGEPINPTTVLQAAAAQQPTSR